MVSLASSLSREKQNRLAHLLYKTHMTHSATEINQSESTLYQTCFKKVCKLNFSSPVWWPRRSITNQWFMLAHTTMIDQSMIDGWTFQSLISEQHVHFDDRRLMIGHLWSLICAKIPTLVYRIQSLQFSPCNSVLAIQSLQFSSCNSVLAIQSLQFSPCNSVLAIHCPCNSVLAIQSLQFSPCNSVLAIQSLQFSPCIAELQGLNSVNQSWNFGTN